MARSRKILAIFLLLIFVAGMFAGCTAKETKTFQSMDDFNQAKIGVLTGSTFDLLAEEHIPNAEKLRHINISDLILNLKQGKIDGILMDKGFFTPLAWEDSSLAYIPMDMPATEYAIAFPKTAESEPLKDQMNEFIRTHTENGWFAELDTKWFSDSEPGEQPDFSQLTGENGTLRVATTVESKPFDYLQDGQFFGYDADFIFRFAEEYGYKLEIDTMDFSALLASIATGRYDLAISSITVTEERQESILFSEPYYKSPIVMVVASNAIAENAWSTLTDLDNATLGIVTGTSWDPVAQKQFPDAPRKYFSSSADVLLALEQGKVDAFFADKTVYAGIRWENSAISYIDEPLDLVTNALIFAKENYDENLLAQINAFIAKSKENGTLDRLSAKWFAEAEPEEHPDYTKLTGENGTISIAIGDSMKPVAYQKGTMYTGYEVDFLTLFAEEYGYKLDLQGMAFEALIPTVTSGKCDIGACGITITPERAESVTFSNPHIETYGVAIIREDHAAQTKTFTSLEDFQNATLGVVTGSSWDLVVQEQFPNAQRMYFNANTDALLALEQDKIDVFFADQTVYTGLQWESASITCIGEPISYVSTGMILPKENYNEVLLEQLNEFIALSKTNGTLDKLSEKWFGDTEPEKHPDYTKLTGENGTIRVAVSDSTKPTTYQRGSMYTGYEVEFLTMFAETYGYILEFEGMAFEALIPTVASGKCDIGTCSITITPERAESVTFADSHFETCGVAIVLEEQDAQNNEMTLAAFENATIGILSGSSFDPLAKERFPNAERKYYSLVPDMILAVEQGKIDAYLSETTYLAAALWEGAKVKAVEEVVDRTNAGYIFQKDGANTVVMEQLNEFLRNAGENGLLEQLQNKWLSSAEPGEIFDSSTLTGENGTLKVAISPDLKPLAYVRGGEVVGYEVEVLQHFAKEYGYQLEFATMTFDAILPGVVAGKYDIGAGGMTITEERAQSVDFSESYLTVDVVMVVSAEEEAAVQSGFWSDVKESFEKTFIREDRWKLIVEGIGVTMLISICSVIAGTLLGFGLYMLSRSDVKLLQMLAKGFAKVYSRIIAGTPVVVILMILFYVVFGKFRDMNGIVVAIIGFTLTFGAFVYDHMTVSVGSVDYGQTEAAYALGYPKNKTFFRIIFPQAMTIFLPSYCGQAVEVIKATAVVGYIAVNDLTKMGDIIRSNTYEAFFPLIATAVIYFLLTWALAALLGLLKARFEPKRRSKEAILKGVKTV